MSAAFVERQLLVSPSLAATLGLEAALLYQLLAEWLPLLDSRESQGIQWYIIDKQRLNTQLPFWDMEKIEEVLRTLNDQGLIIIGAALMSNAQNIRLAFTQAKSAAQAMQANTAAARTESPTPQTTAQQPVHKGSLAANTTRMNQYTNTANPRHPVPGNNIIAADWLPDQAGIDYLTRFNQVDPAFINAVLPEFIAHYRDTGETRSSWNSAFSQYVSRRWKKEQYQKIELARNQPIGDSWKPSLDALEILERDGISRNFIEDAIPEFTLFWRERGTADSNWNSRFIQHIRLQWARYTNAVSNENVIAPIPSNWQPNDSVFDILRMARIDPEFAKAQIAEFILFWQDSGQAHRSWNTKFLQHVKYRWANNHQLGQSDARQQQAPGASKPATGFIAKHTDRSWADEL
ncbi:DnaT-like ssDNA-binding domain-containing protein [Zhongshania sp.]|uniref:DnaT-like ssDNA-binding domain-containing protein n=1 Tax=Zhongshania sp. TaxID=1971902 RepID=UPI003569C459